jgi:hypothetical protein
MTYLEIAKFARNFLQKVWPAAEPKPLPSIRDNTPKNGAVVGSSNPTPPSTVQDQIGRRMNESTRLEPRAFQASDATEIQCGVTKVVFGVRT